MEPLPKSISVQTNCSAKLSWPWHGMSRLTRLYREVVMETFWPVSVVSKVSWKVRHGEDGRQHRAILAVVERAAEGDEDADCRADDVSMDVTLRWVAIITSVGG